MAGGIQGEAAWAEPVEAPPDRAPRRPNRVSTPGAPPMYVQATCSYCGGHRRLLNGLWLRYRREEAGLSLKAMARRARVSGPYLSDVELGKRQVTERLLKVYRRLPEKGTT